MVLKGKRKFGFNCVERKTQMATLNVGYFIERHEAQLVLSGVPSHFWATLFEKLKDEIFDAGDYFSMVPNVDEEVAQLKIICNREVLASDAACIFLIDHAFSYERVADAKKALTDNEILLQRLIALTETYVNDADRPTLIQRVLDKLWLYNQTYSVGNFEMGLEDKRNVWYIMDEFGSRIKHKDEPTFRLVPFFCEFLRLSFSLLFPVKDCQPNDEVTRDYVESCTDKELRKFYLLPWIKQDFLQLSTNFRIPEDSYLQERLNLDLSQLKRNIEETIPQKPQMKVYIVNEKIKANLKHASFEIVDDASECDILWLDTHIDDFKHFLENNRHVFVNQFPYEELITAKDLLAAIVHYQVIQPPWFAITYNLKVELPQFVSVFQKRQKLQLNNTWIIKPWNLARGLDTHVTINLDEVIRLLDSGPKLACKYIDDPVLFLRDDTRENVKFDMRYIVLLKSLQPLKLYVYNRFWLRFALKSFSLDTFDDYEKHFTVFNYLDSEKIKQMFCDDFVQQFNEQFPHLNWKDIENKIHSSFKELFEIASTSQPHRGLANCSQSRAIYGIDVMLSWATNEKNQKYVQPILLEVNFMPDCARACNYYPDFVDTVFQTLFFENVPPNLPVTLL